ncbi:MAG: extracellular solute-binding protein [Clostridia bacterium]|nr:extracellular solute-binding protein [Clostridia bacterium]
MKKSLIALLALALLLTICPTALAEDAPVVLTVTVPSKTNIEDYETNLTTLYIEEALGVDLQFNVLSSDQYQDKINLMINSNEPLSDIVMFSGKVSDDVIYSWAQEGAIAPLTEFYYDEELAVNIYESFDRVGTDYRPQMIMPDGEIYYLPQFNQSYGNEYSGKLWYYPAWLEAVGGELPETLDELCDLLRAIVSTDLNGNGIADEIGLTGWNGINGQWFSYLMNSFLYYDTSNNHVKIEDGTLSFSYTEEAFREGVEYIAGMIEEGLVAPEAVSQKQAEWTTMINSADHSVFLVSYTTPSQIMDGTIKAQYEILPPVEGPDGVCYSMFNPSVANAYMVVSSACEHPELAFAVGDLMCSELLSITTRWGQEGVDWDYVANTDDPSQYAGNYAVFGAYLIIYNDAQFWSSGGMQNRAYMQVGPFVRQYGLAGGRAVKVGNESPYDLHIAEGDTLYQTGGYMPAEVISKLIFSAEETEIMNGISTDLNTYVNETVAGWLLDGASLTDEAWTTFLATVDEMGAYDLLECMQAAYDRTK